MTAWSVAALPAPGPSAQLPSLVVSARAHCDGATREVALSQDADRFSLVLPADTEWMGWSRESGVDLVIHTADPRGIRTVVLDSAPARYADDPLWLRADGLGRTSMRIQALGRSQHPSWSIELFCIQALSATERARMGAIFEFAQHMHGWLEHGGHARLLPWLSALVRLQIAVDGDQQARTWLDFQLATVARRAGFLAESHGWFNRALAHAEALQRDELAVMAQLGVGKTELNLGRATAQTHLQDAAVRAQRAGLHYPAFVAAQDLCVLHRLAGRVPEAVACYLEAVDRSRALAEWADFANAQSNLASALVSQGDLVGARRALHAALLAADQYDSPRARLTAARLLALVQSWSGDYVEALSTLDEALRTLDPNRPVERGQLLATLAGTYTLMGESRRALQIYSAVIADMRVRGESVRAQLLTLPAAEVELRLGLPDAAASRLRDWLREVSSASASDAIQLGRLALAVALADLGDLEAARAEYAKVGRGSAQWDWTRRLRALDLELRLGLHAGDAAETVLARAGEEALAQRHDLAHVGVVALALRHRPARDRSAVHDIPWFEPAAAERMRRTAQVLRSPELRSGLLARLRPLATHQALLVPSGPIDGAKLLPVLGPVEDLRAIEQRPAEATDENALAMLERSVSIAALGGDPGASGGRDATTALAWYAGFHAAPAGSLPTRPWDLPALAPGQALLYPVLGEHRGSLFVGQQGGWQVIAELDAAQLRRATRSLLTGMETGRIARAELDLRLAAVRDAIGWERIHFDRHPGRLLIVTEGELGALPWELLVMARVGAGQAASDALPELVLLQSLRPSAATARVARVIALGPQGTQPGGLHALPAAGREPDDIVRIWSQNAAADRMHGSASELMRALGTPNALVHVAGHAQAGAGLAEDAGLWIGSGERPEFLSALRLAQTNSSAALVVLNACETGRAYAPGRIGLAGAAGSLVNGGAHQVIATRWPVADRTARRFAVLLHEQLRGSVDPARALRAAQDALRALPTHRHPADWAAWFLLQSGPARQPPD